MTDFFLNNISIVIGILLAITYIPQIAKLHKTRSIEGVSLLFWIVLSFTLSLALINSLVVFVSTGVWGYMFIEIINVSLALVVLGQVIAIKKGVY